MTEDYSDLDIKLLNLLFIMSKEKFERNVSINKQLPVFWLTEFVKFTLLITITKFAEVDATVKKDPLYA